MTNQPSDRRLPSIQVLRGIAASLVVFFHYSQVIRNQGFVNSWIVNRHFNLLSAAGVDIFFVISGFIMVYTTQRKAGLQDSLAFLRKRLLRIFPLYWFWTTVSLLLWAFNIALVSHHHAPRFILDSYLLIPCFNGVNYLPLLIQGWTLSFEMLFYLLFAASILLGLGKGKLPFLAAAFAALAFFGRLFPSPSGLRYLLSNPLIIEFLFGVLAAQILLRLPRNLMQRRILPIALIAGGVLALLCTVNLTYDGSLRFLAWGVPALLIVFGAAILGPAPAPRLLTYLGNASYSIYITHIFFSMVYELAFKHFSILRQLPPDAVILVAGLLTIALASLTYPLIERPLTRAITRSVTRSRSPQAI